MFKFPLARDNVLTFKALIVEFTPVIYKSTYVLLVASKLVVGVDKLVILLLFMFKSPEAIGNVFTVNPLIVVFI